jgi:hypothetical protein
VRSLDLRSDDLLDSLGDVGPPAMTGGSGTQPPAWASADVGFDRGACELGDSGATPLRLVTKPGVKLIWEFDRGALHRYASIPHANAVGSGRTRCSRCLTKRCGDRPRALFSAVLPFATSRCVATLGSCPASVVAQAWDRSSTVARCAKS